MLTDKKVSPDYNSFGNRKKNPLNFFCTYGVSFLYVFILALFVFNYITMTRVRVLENELEVLKQALSIDDKLIKEIIGLEETDEDIEAYDTEQDPKIVIPSYGSINEYEYEYNDDVNENDTVREDSYTKFLNKFVNNLNLSNKDKDTNKTFIEKKEDIRKKRDIVSATSDGVVINSETYAQKKAKNVSSRYNLRGGSVTQYPARPSSIGSQWPVYPYSYSTAAYLKRIKPTKAPDVYVRSSRTKHYEDKSRAFRQKVKLSDLKSLDSYQESNEETTTYTPPITIVRNTGFRRRSIKHLPSVHYGGDTSKYTLGVHENYYGNSQLRHLNEIFVDWKPKKWVNTLRMDSHFSLESGYLTVKQSGLYLVYAQIYYMDSHDTVGYRIFKNGQTILQCTVTSPSTVDGRMKGNTCYTAGVEHFQAGDKLSISDIEQRLSLFEEGKSFFGLVKLGDIRV